MSGRALKLTRRVVRLAGTGWEGAETGCDGPKTGYEGSETG